MQLFAYAQTDCIKYKEISNTQIYRNHSANGAALLLEAHG